MTVKLSALGGAGWQFFSDNGVPLAGGKLYVYLAGTTTPATTYTTSAGSIANSNPIVFDAFGRVPSEIWLTEGSLYKFVLKNSSDTQIWEKDNIPAINDALEVTSLTTNLANTTDAAKGDALVGFRQSNASGNLANAVGKTVHQKFQEMVSVLDFGAYNDGTNATATTAAINNALALANSLYFPPGTYLVNGNINIQNKSLFGGNRRTTIIQLSGSNTNTPMFINSANSSSSWGSGGGFTIQGLDLRGNWDGSTANPVGINFPDQLGSLIKWYAGAYCTLLESRISSSFAHGIYFQRLGYSYISYNEITTNKYDGIHAEGPNGSDSVTSTEISFNSIHSCRGNALIYLANAISVHVTNGVYEDATCALYIAGGDNRQIAFTQNYTESVDVGVNYQGTGLDVIVTDNFLSAITTPINISNPLSLRTGLYTRNTFGNYDFTSSVPQISNGYGQDHLVSAFAGQISDGTAALILSAHDNNNANAGTPIAQVQFVHSGTVNQVGGKLWLRTADPATNTLATRVVVGETGVFYPYTDNTQSLGGAGNRWSVVYAGNGTINTSDENEKTDFEEISDAEKCVALKIKKLLKRYRFKDAVAKKGNNARYHFGAVAQEVAQAFAAEGLDAERYGIFCSDTWREYDGHEVMVDEDNKYVVIHHEFEGKKIDPSPEGKFPEGTTQVVEKFDTVERTRLGLRYDELFAFVLASI